MILLLIPFLYIGFVASISNVMPPVDYKALNQGTEVTAPIQNSKSSNQIPVPAQDPQAKPVGKTGV